MKSGQLLTAEQAADYLHMPIERFSLFSRQNWLPTISIQLTKGGTRRIRYVKKELDIWSKTYQAWGHVWPIPCLRNLGATPPVPACLETIADRVREHVLYRSFACIYFHINSNEITYIGKTTSIGDRQRGHRGAIKTKSQRLTPEFVFYFEVQEHTMSMIESALIHALRPRFNTAGSGIAFSEYDKSVLREAGLFNFVETLLSSPAYRNIDNDIALERRRLAGCDWHSPATSKYLTAPARLIRMQP
jgi:hypothetical protein